MDYPEELFRLVVIADNCTDETARVARSAGAEVLERRDPSRKSKGHALRWFFETTDTLDRCDAVVVIDADTVVDRDLLTRFAAEISTGRDWLQAYYTVRNADASWRTRLMTFAFSLFNGVWLLGQDRLGLGAGLRGNGMCFSATGLRRVPWEAYGLTEDQEFAWRLRLNGERVSFSQQTHVYGEMVRRGGSAAEGQRLRWEAGRKSLRKTYANAIFRAPTLGIPRKLLFLIELYFPSLVGLASALAAAACIHALARTPIIGGGLALMMAVLLGYLLSPFVLLGLPPRYLASLSALPYYAAWKVLVAVRAKPSTWVRTPRELPSPVEGACPEWRLEEK